MIPHLVALAVAEGGRIVRETPHETEQQNTESPEEEEDDEDEDEDEAQVRSAAVKRLATSTGFQSAKAWKVARR